MEAVERGVGLRDLCGPCRGWQSRGGHPLLSALEGQVWAVLGNSLCKL